MRPSVPDRFFWLTPSHESPANIAHSTSQGRWPLHHTWLLARTRIVHHNENLLKKIDKPCTMCVRAHVRGVGVPQVADIKVYLCIGAEQVLKTQVPLWAVPAHDEGNEEESATGMGRACVFVCVCACRGARCGRCLGMPTAG